MKRHILFICFFVATCTGTSQNLVPNGSFECYSTCPDQYDQVNYAKHWSSPVPHNGSWPDYHNSCDLNNGMGFPLNGNTGDSARTGAGCMGFMFWQNYDPASREYLQAKLLQPLQNGKCYQLTFYVKLYVGLNMGIDRIGAHFSTTAISSVSQNLYGYVPQVQNTPGVPISSTTAWTQISGSFVATGGEDYITIGNFYNNAATTTDGNPSGWYTHYYIDDICLIECGNSCTTTITGVASVCSGAAATLSTTAGGTTYSWSNGTTTTTTTVHPTTNTQYSVIVNDTVACQTYYDTTAISVFPLPSLTLTPTPVSCFGGTNGKATVAVSSGTFPYTYSWSPGGQTGVSATNLSSGTYSVNVTDANGCTSQGTITVTQPTVLTASITAQSNLLCNGNSNAFAKVTGFGGAPGYTYSWNNAQTTGTATGLSAATYTASVTDLNGCTAKTTVTITQPSVLTASISAKTNVSCNGNSNGTATVVAGGGTLNYTYSWSNAQTTGITTGLSATTYTATVTDANGCVAQTTVTITQPPILRSSISAQINVLCDGNNTGSATVAAVGGASAYTYSWSNAQTNTTVTGLFATTYSVIVTDANGCTSQTTVIITQPAVLTASISAQTNVLCNGNNAGTATVAAGGGTVAYTYNWNNGHTNAIATNLSATTYTATVTDANGCTIKTTATITEPSVLTLTLTPINLLCNNISTGQVSSNVMGGTPNYTYSWSTTSTTNNISSLAAAGYTLTITDNNGCTIQKNTAITQPSAVTMTLSSTPDHCNQQDGAATIVAGGGTGAYTYSWSSVQNSSSISNISAGTYTATVTDNNGCSLTQTIAVAAQASDTLQIVNTSSVTCNGACNGSATLQLSGVSNGPYTYNWSNGQNSLSATGLCAGIHTCSVTDGVGCLSTKQIIIIQPAVLTASISAQTNVLCNGNNSGNATVVAGGGTGTYTYSWSNGQTNTTATNLSATAYSVTVTDNNGCTTQTTITITEPSVLSLTLTPTNLLCNNISTGSVNSNVLGGTPNYSYSWNTTATTNNISSLAIGNYSLTVTDNNGCSILASTTITQPSALTMTLSSTPDHCNQGDGTANVIASGGTGAYSYTWSNAQNNSSISNLSANTYTATVRDNNGCLLTQAVAVLQQVSDTLQIVSINDVTCNNACDGSVTLQLSGVTNPPYSYQWSNGQTNLTATGLCAGVHTCSVTDGVGCLATKQITIAQPSVLTASISIQTDVLCNGNNTGSATVVANGGTPNYIYSWSNGQTNAVANNLTATTFTVTVTDNHGCTVQTSVTITEPPVLTLTLTPTDLLCNNIPTGQVISNVQGGAPNYTYNWNTIASTNNISSLAIGNYSLTVTDNNGCTLQKNTTITQPSALSMTLTSTPDHCNQGDGTANVIAGGGTGAYTYTWSNAQNNSSISNLSANTYTATVTDNNGCSLSQAVVVMPQVSDTLKMISTGNVSCNAVCDGTATLQLSSIANGPYTYNWSNGQTTLAVTGLCAGVHTCSVVDGVGCLITKQIAITQPSVLTASISAQTDVLCSGNNTGDAIVVASGGTPNYTYNWSNTQTNAVANNLTANTFSVIVSDNNGCTVQATVTITEPPVLSLTLTPADLLCSGIATGQVNSNVQGGMPNYTYSWSNAAITNNISSLAAGTYSLTVTDNNGCTVQSSVILSQPTAITLTVTSTPDHCNLSDGTATVSANGGTGAYTYSWSNISQTINNPNGLAAGTYTVIVTDNNQCTQSTMVNVLPMQADTLQLVSIKNVSCNNNCDGIATLQLSGVSNAPHNYNWNTAMHQNSLAATGLCAGVYSCTVTDVNGCKDMMSVSISQPAVLSATLSASSTLCYGDNTGTATVTNVSGGTPNYSYSWNNNQLNANATALTAGAYTVTITDNNNCSITQIIQVNDMPLLIVNIPTPAEICAGQQAIVNSNVAGGTPNYNYSWSSGQNTNGINPSLNQTTNFTITVTDNNGCTAQAITQATVNALPVVSFTSDLTQGCAPLCVNFNNTTANSQSQTWNFGDGSGSALNAPYYCFTQAGAYNITLVVTDNKGCIDSLTQNNYINVYPNPAADFLINPNPSAVNTVINFIDKSVGATTWSWSFGDAINSSSNLQSPTFIYTDSGYYQIRLIIVNEFGCSDTSIQLLFIEPEFLFYIPNTFTPNGDGLNDVFAPSLFGIENETFEFYIFDRWGDKIFESNSSTVGWNGVANSGSEIAQQDTYVWLIKLKDIHGNRHKYVGHVNLIK